MFILFAHPPYPGIELVGFIVLAAIATGAFEALGVGLSFRNRSAARLCTALACGAFVSIGLLVWLHEVARRDPTAARVDAALVGGALACVELLLVTSHARNRGWFGTWPEQDRSVTVK